MKRRGQEGAACAEESGKRLDDPQHQEVPMKRWIAPALTSVAMATAPAALAAPPIQVSEPVDASFEIDSLSDACGVPVTLAITGTLAAKAFTGADGTIVREIDTSPGTKLTYSTEGGGSITIPFSGVFHATYPEGATLGAPVTVTVTGNTGPFFDAIGPGSGRLQFETVVEDFTEDGIPLWRLTGLSAPARGNFTQTQRICSALTG